MNEVTAALILRVTVLAAPPLALVCYFLVRRWAPHALKPIIAASIVWLIALAILIELGVSFVAPSADIVTLATAYSGYCVLAACCLAIPYVALRIIACIIATLPALLGYAVAIWGYGFQIGALNAFAEPAYVERVSDNITCRIIDLPMWGLDVGGGTVLTLVRSLVPVPFVEWTVSTTVLIYPSVVPFDPARYGDDPFELNPSIACADALEKYDSRLPRFSVVVKPWVQEDLPAKCRTMVFQKYGSDTGQPLRGMFAMKESDAKPKIEACVASSGTTY